MKKINSNNRFRSNNNGNSIYSLNYKFDSVSIAGKFNGTALDLIKKYNELAKEAQSRGDYVDMEVFRQYAEHYRKIVTEINARKSQNNENNQQNQIEQSEEQIQPQNVDNNVEQNVAVNNNLVETEAAPRVIVEEKTASGGEEISGDSGEKKVKRSPKRSFTIVEVGKNEAESVGANENEKNESEPKKRRAPRKKVVAQSEEA